MIYPQYVKRQHIRTFNMKKTSRQNNEKQFGVHYDFVKTMHHFIQLV